MDLQQINAEIQKIVQILGNFSELGEVGKRKEYKVYLFGINIQIH